MKERVVLFSDAVIAIILTIMVLELPIDLTSGSIDFLLLFRGVGIYFISFCFVANLWFETAQSFNKVENVRNKDLVVYLLSLFFLSLVPKSTGLLIEDTAQDVMLLYGVLTLIVLVLTQYLITSLTKQAISEGQALTHELRIQKGRNRINIFLRIALLVVSYFFVQFGLIVYLVLPIVSFLQNIVDREEHEIVRQMDTPQQDFYLQDQQRFWGNTARKYSRLLQASLSDSEAKGDDWWQEFNQQWEQRLDDLIAQTQQKLSTASKSDQQQLQRELQRLQREKEMLHRKMTQLQKTQRSPSQE